jgi:hypothetical protein
MKLLFMLAITLFDILYCRVPCRPSKSRYRVTLPTASPVHTEASFFRVNQLGDEAESYLPTVSMLKVVELYLHYLIRIHGTRTHFYILCVISNGINLYSIQLT